VIAHQAWTTTPSRKKHIMRSITLVTAALVATLALASCGDDGDSSGDAGGDGKAPVFGIPSPLASEPGEHNINLGITCYADKIDAEVKVLDANLDVNKQITDFDSLLAQGVNVLTFLPLDPQAFTAPFERADDANAVVVELYNPESTAPGAAFEDGPSAGADAVELVSAEFPDGATAIVIGGPPIPAVTARIAGFTDNAEAAGIEILEQADNLKDNVNDAKTLADTLFTKHPDANVVFAFNDNSAIGAGLAAESRGLEDVMIFGINGTPDGIDAVKDGLITATYDSDQWGMGYQAAEMGHQILEGESVEPLQMEFKRWDADNAADWVPAEERCAAQQ
jgi:ribose transport system substrate-binding protein